MMPKQIWGLQLVCWSLFVFACTLPTEQIQEDYLILSCDLPQDSSGVYQYMFPISLSQSYFTIHVQSTPLTLFLLPSLYMAQHDLGRLIRRIPGLEQFYFIPPVEQSTSPGPASGSCRSRR